MTRNQPQQWTTYSAIVGSVLARHRSERGLDQRAFAAGLSISQATWSRIERGLSSITAAQLADVSDYLDLQPNEVVAEADYIVQQLIARGVRVYHYRPEKPVGPTLALAGAGALALAMALLKKSDQEE